MNDLDLDALLNNSVPLIDHPTTCDVCRDATRRTKTSRRKTQVAAIVLVSGALVGVGGVAAAIDGTSLATHLGWRSDTAVSKTNTDGNTCHLGFRAIPEAGIVGQRPVRADAPEVREAQAYLSSIDLDTYVVPAADVQALKDRRICRVSAQPRQPSTPTPTGRTKPSSTPSWTTFATIWLPRE